MKDFIILKSIQLAAILTMLIAVTFIASDIHQYVNSDTHKELDKDGVIRVYSNRPSYDQILDYTSKMDTVKFTPVHTYETDDTGFYNGEILLPDYIHIDTLVVTKADVLNWCMEHYDISSNGDIVDILRISTKLK